MKKIVVSGIKPSGPLHIGNYLGALRYWLQLQDDPQYHCYFFIADLHALTIPLKAKRQRNNIENILLELLAIGLNPKKSTIFIQSRVQAHAELGWIFDCITPISELDRMTQYKDETRKGRQANAGLFTYPVLQAADILIYNGQFVPVGEDQVQHLELSRKIARWFNSRYGKTFPEPKPLLTPTPRVMSLASPLQKMSKSHGEKTVISLADEPVIIKTKIQKAVTESTGKIPVKYEGGQWKLKTGAEKNEGIVGAFNLLKLLEEFGTEEENLCFAKQPISYKNLKEAVTQTVAGYFADFRAERKKLLKQKNIESKLSESTKAAEKVANKTLSIVRKKIGIR